MIQARRPDRVAVDKKARTYQIIDTALLGGRIVEKKQEKIKKISKYC